MRAYAGQKSDSQPIHRSLEQKERLLRELQEDRARMKPHANKSLRDSLDRRIQELTYEIRQASRHR